MDYISMLCNDAPIPSHYLFYLLIVYSNDLDRDASFAFPDDILL